MCSTRTAKKYALKLLFNGVTVSKRTDDIAETIVEVAPELLLTEMYVTAKKGKDVAERKLDLVHGRKLFNDAIFREIFVNNLLLQ